MVEDNEINQQVAKEILEDAGLLVTIAENGQIGVDQVHKTRFDAVLMDIQMPIMDGYEATLAIRKEVKFDSLPIIAMSANAMTQDKEKAKQVGMDDYVPKPVNVKELFTVLLKWIEHKERPFLEKITKTKKPAKEAEEINIPELPGIDIETGLSRVGGIKSLYVKTLNKFMCSFPGSYTGNPNSIK